MTFDDDFMEFKMLSGPPKRVTLKSQGLEWPPPARVNFMEFPYRRVGYSRITDEERRGMTHVCRGAEYEFIEAK
jgi:hypothetical protein